MQVIAVERWTFWSAVVAAVFGPVLATGFGAVTIASPGGTTTSMFAPALAGVVFVLLIVSVYLGGTRDPTVRRIPVQRTP